MGVVITRDDIIAYAEVDYIIHHMNEKYINKVPEKLLNFFGSIKDPNYVVHIDPRIPLQSQNLKKYTLELIALLHLKYWCEDDNRRNMLYQKMLENQKKLDKQMQEIYNIDNMFDLNSAKVVKSESDLNHQKYSSLSDNETNIDFSTPKPVVKYDLSNQDYSESSFNESVRTENNTTKIVDKEKAISTKINFLENLINKIKSKFSK